MSEFKFRKATLRGVAGQSALLMVLWLLLSGKYDLFHLLLGVLSVAIVMLLNSRIDRLRLFEGGVREWEPMRYTRFLRYVPWLLWQMVLASTQVAYVALHPRVPIDPSLLRFRADLPNQAARVILGNSITLTPGTLTLEIRDDEFWVYSLTDRSLKGLVSGAMPRKVARLFRKAPGQVVSDVRIDKKAESL